MGLALPLHPVRFLLPQKPRNEQDNGHPGDHPYPVGFDPRKKSDTENEQSGGDQDPLQYQIHHPPLNIYTMIPRILPGKKPLTIPGVSLYDGIETGKCFPSSGRQ
jgi:hypothetical protein